MESKNAIAALAALAQATRLETFRLLVKAEPEGIPAGELARMLDIPQNTMSAHLATLARAGIVKSERQGRSIIYRANIDGFRELTLFLLMDCCGGNAKLCAPLASNDGMSPEEHVRQVCAAESASIKRPEAGK